jgi:hypothetical protein
LQVSLRSRLRTLASVSWIFFLVCSLISSPLLAQEEEGDFGASEETFASLVEKATAEYKKGNYDEAVNYLQKANFKQENPQLLFNIAKAYQKKNDCKHAMVYFKAYKRHPDAQEKVIKFADKEIRGLRGCIDYDPKNTSGRLMVLTEPPGATVEVDGEQLGVTPFEVGGMPAGEHVLVIELEGYQTVEKTVTLEAEKNLRVEEELEEPKPEGEDGAKDGDTGPGDGEGVEEPEEPEEPTEPGYKLNIPAVAIAGGGVALLTTALIIDLGTLPSIDRERANFDPSSPEYQDLTDRRSTMATIAIVSYSVGGALLVGGAAWFIVDYLGQQGGGDEEATAGASGIRDLGVYPVVGRDVTGVGMGFRF